MKLNKKVDKAERGISSHNLASINRLILDFDCQYQSLVHRENVNLLYGDNTFSHCHNATQQVKPKLMYDIARDIAALLCKKSPASKNCQSTTS